MYLGGGGKPSGGMVFGQYFVQDSWSTHGPSSLDRGIDDDTDEGHRGGPSVHSGYAFGQGSAVSHTPPEGPGEGGAPKPCLLMERACIGF